MADMNLTDRPDGTGQTGVGVMTFNEPNPPADGAWVSDTPSVATISFDADLVTYRVAKVGNGAAIMSYTGTSAPPAVGPAVVAHNPFTVMCTPAPVAEMGDSNVGAATIS
jgi:hypothetical protein